MYLLRVDIIDYNRPTGGIMVVWVNHRCLQVFLNGHLFSSHSQNNPFNRSALVKNIGVCGGVFMETESCPLLDT